MDRQRVDVGGQGEALGGDHLEGVPGPDVLLHRVDGGHVGLGRHVGLGVGDLGRRRRGDDRGGDGFGERGDQRFGGGDCGGVGAVGI